MAKSSRQHLRDALSRREANDVDEIHLPEPFAIVANLQMLGIGAENLANLRDVRARIRVDLFAGEHLAGLVAPRRIADARGVVADNDNGLVAPVLELSHDRQWYRMAEGHVGGGGVHAQLDPHRLAGLGAAFELGPQVLVGQDPLASAGQGLAICWSNVSA